MNMKLVEEITASQIKKDLPNFGPGDTVKVHVRIVEGNKERIQVFQGQVISRRGSGISETFIVRKLSSSVGVERVFPIHSPLIAKIEVLKRGDVRRSKLFYLREREGKGAKIAEDRKLTAESMAKEAEERAIAKKAAQEAEVARLAAKKAAEEEAKKAAEEAKKAEAAKANEAPKAEEAKQPEAPVEENK